MISLFCRNKKKRDVVADMRINNVLQLSKELVGWADLRFDRVIRFRKELPKVISDNVDYRIDTFVLWHDDEDIIYGVALVVSHLKNHDNFMAEISLYSKYGYKASRAIFVFNTANEFFEWLRRMETPEECSHVITELYDCLNSTECR